MNNHVNKRIESIDVTRGFIVASSVFLTHIPFGYDLLRNHAEWYGLTIVDLIFPAFLTMYGVSIVIAYNRKIRWKKVLRRTILLIVFGLLFNMIVLWDFNLANIRFTGVLQLFAIVGLIVVMIMYFTRKWWMYLVLGLLFLFSYALLLKFTSLQCTNGLPQPDCNLSGIVDTYVFGKEHIYVNGKKNYDPEGLISLIGATGNALIGMSAGGLLLYRRKEGKSPLLPLISVVLGLLFCTFIFQKIIPIGKPIWSPPFATLTSAITIAFVVFFYFIVEIRKYPFRVLNAFGRNSFFIYFGKDGLASIVINLSLFGINPKERLLGFIPLPLGYAFFMLVIWTIVACVMHRKKWYIRI